MTTPQQSPLVSILFVSNNRPDLLKRAIESCLLQDYKHIEFVIIDNNSEVRLEDYLADTLTSAHIFRTHKNIGFFPALNLAIASSKGEFIITIDDDAYFKSTDAISTWLKKFAEDPKLMIATCNITGPHELSPEPTDRYVHNFKTGFSMIRRDVFSSICGYYPDVFFRSGGEAYLCTMLLHCGYHILQVSGIYMHHDQTTIGRNLWAWNYYGHRSQNLLVFYRMPLLFIPISLTVKFFKGLVGVLTQKTNFLPWVRAWTDLPFFIPEAMRQRNPISVKSILLMRALKLHKVTSIQAFQALKNSTNHLDQKEQIK
jgi:GT2 family glycosyltransferase